VAAEGGGGVRVGAIGASVLGRWCACVGAVGVGNASFIQADLLGGGSVRAEADLTVVRVVVAAARERAREKGKERNGQRPSAEQDAAR
jgi:hypothetical protein